MKDFIRGPSEWNKTRRLGAESLKLYAQQLEDIISEAERQLDVIEEAKQYL